MTITADSFTKIDLHDDLARCYRCLRQNLAYKNQLDCRIRCHSVLYWKNILLMYLASL